MDELLIARDELTIMEEALRKINMLYINSMETSQFQAAVEATMAAAQLESTIYKYQQQQKAFEAQKASEAEYETATQNKPQK